MPRFCANLWVALVLFVPLWAFSAPFAHASDASGKAAPQGKDLPRAENGRPIPPSAEHKGVIPPPPIGDEGIYKEAPNPEAGDETSADPENSRASPRAANRGVAFGTLPLSWYLAL